MTASNDDNGLDDGDGTPPPDRLFGRLSPVVQVSLPFNIRR